MFVITLFLYFACSIVLIGLFRIYAIKKKLLDNPNHRSSHVVPTPRGGGIVFPILWLFYAVTSKQMNAGFLCMFVFTTILISGISFLDDRYNIRAKWRFLIQLIAAIISLVAIGGFSSIDLGFWQMPLGLLGSVFAVLLLLWSTNLFNFMDGTDGIAGIEALFVLGVGGYFIWNAGGLGFAKLIWVLGAIVLGFLVWNKPKAKIFMGDVGSALLGFLIILFAIIGEVLYKVPLLLWIILYGVFCFDASITLIRRVLHKEKWYEAHRSHAYQRLQLQNWSHGKILVGVMIINAILAVLAVLAFHFSQYLLVFLAVTILFLTAVYLLIEKIQPMYLK